MTAANIRIVEVGPRDGLQNEPATLSVADRIALIDALAGAGLRSIEAGSFVSPRWVPKMADTAEVLAGLSPRPGVRYPVLVPNLTGLAAARAAGAREIAVFAAASETFSQHNTNCGIAESLERLRLVIGGARADGLPVRGYVSCVLGCPYEGDVALARVVAVAEALATMGCYEISLGDTIGVGTPAKAVAMVRAVAASIATARLAVHFHDTYGQALANVLACLEEGVAVVDTAVAGLGGCPYAKGASGNLATEELVYMLEGMGMVTSVDLGRLIAAGQVVCAALGRPNNSKVALAWPARGAA